MRSLLKESRDEDKSLVGFVVGNVRYGIDILRVREIINPLPVVQLPNFPPIVLGVADHRGEVLPVIELRRRFGLSPQDPTRRTKWMIVRSQDRSVGIVVDAVTDVFGVQEDEARQLPLFDKNEAHFGISGVYSQQGGLVFVIDVDQLSSPAEAIDLRLLTGMIEEANGDDAR